MQILTIASAIKKSQELREANKKIVVAGGCFDILHLGHIRFLEAAKRRGDVLFILLESDENVRKIKGEKRPFNFQKERAEALSSIKYVDFVVLLSDFNKNEEYDDLIEKIGPKIIATTQNDPSIHHKKRQAKKTKAKVALVIPRLTKSTTKLAKKMRAESL